MAGGWHVRLEHDLPDVEIVADGGRALLYHQRQIDELAERLALPPLSGFFSTDPESVGNYLAEQGLDPASFDLPEEEWFDAADGLATVQGLIAALRTDGGEIPQAERVLADLEIVEQNLSVAALHNVRFHLARHLTAPE
jgi:hypothetical protein